MSAIFKHFEIQLLKVGKILRHITKVGTRQYEKSKVYLRDNKDVGKSYEL